MICLTICSMAVALPVYAALQWHLLTLGLQVEQTKCPLLQLKILRGGFINSMQMGHSGIREAAGGAGWSAWEVRGPAGATVELAVGGTGWTAERKI